MPVTIICDPNTLATQAKCYSAQCLGPDDRHAIDLYTRVQEAAALGIVDYRTNLKQLTIDGKGWGRLPEDTRNAITLLLNIDNAINKGASFSTNINSLRTAAKCYLCLPWEQREALLLYLKCLLNKAGAPE